MAIPRKPAAALFTPFTDAARVIGSPFHGDGSLTDVEYRLLRLSTGAIIAGDTVGSGDRAFTITSLALLEGETYAVRLRYKNADGWSAWSRPRYAQVPVDLPFTELNVPAEPAAGGSLPIDPDFPVELPARRELTEHITQTGNRFRRLAFTAQRRATRLTWNSLRQSEAATLLAFLQARVAAGESFTTANPILGSRRWIVRQGRIERVMVDHEAGAGAIFAITAECDEVHAP